MYRIAVKFAHRGRILPTGGSRPAPTILSYEQSDKLKVDIAIIIYKGAGNTRISGRKKYAKFWKKVLDFFRRMRIIRFVREIEDLCNGSTPDSDSVCGGSNPSSSAKKKTTPKGCGFLFAIG